MRFLSTWYFFYFAFVGIFAPYFALYLNHLHLSAWDIGVLTALMPVMRLLAPGLWSLIADQIGRRAVVVRTAATLAVVSALALFLVRDFWGLFFALSLIAFFWSASLPLVEAITLGHLHDRSERYGRIRIGGSVGFIVAVLGAGALLDVVSIAFMPLLIWLLLAGLATCAWLLRDPPPATQTHHRDHVPLRVALRRPEVFAFLAAGFFMSAAHGPLYVFYSLHLVNHGYDKVTIGMLWSLGVIAEIVAFAYIPRLMRKTTLQIILMACFALAVLRFLLIGWAPDIPFLLLIAQLLHGVTFGAYHAASVATLHQWFPPRHQAHAQALYGSLTFGAGGILGNLASGSTWDTLGAPFTYSMGATFAAVGFLLIWKGLSSPP